MDEVLLGQAEQQLVQQERVAVGAGGEREQLRVGRRAQDVLRDRADGARLERREPQPAGPLGRELVGGAQQRHRRLTGAERHEPHDGMPRERRRERAEALDRPRVGPLEVVEHDEHRRGGRAALEQLLELLEQPVALLGNRLQVGAAQQRLGPVEQRGEQRSHRDHGLPGARAAAAGGDAEPAGDPQRLVEQPRLAQPGGALDEQHAARAVARGAEDLPDEGGLAVAASQRGRRHRGWRVHAARNPTRQI